MPPEAESREDRTGLRKLLYQQQWLDEVQAGLGPNEPPVPDRVLGVVAEIGLESNAAIVAGGPTQCGLAEVECAGQSGQVRKRLGHLPVLLQAVDHLLTQLCRGGLVVAAE